MCFYGLGHVSATGYDESAIASAGFRLEHPVLEADAHQETFRYIVAVEPCTVDVEDGLYELWCQFAHLVDGELHEQLVGLLLPHVADGEVDEEVVVGLSHLQEALASLHVLHEVGCVAPDAVGG